jgi:hypothetical protein
LTPFIAVVLRPSGQFEEFLLCVLDEEIVATDRDELAGPEAVEEDRIVEEPLPNAEFEVDGEVENVL